MWGVEGVADGLLEDTSAVAGYEVAFEDVPRPAGEGEGEGELKLYTKYRCRLGSHWRLGMTSDFGSWELRKKRVQFFSAMGRAVPRMVRTVE